jgi:3-oxoacyl-[acyl-carrier protein] reductase
MAYRQGDVALRILRFEDIAVGQRADLTHVLTQSDVEAFAALSGDYNPLHMDEEFARKTQFRKPVVHGMIPASFISTLIGMMLPGGGALWTSQKMDFVNPARVGDVLRAEAVVTQKSPSTQTVVLAVRVTNQDGRDLVVGESIVRMLKMQEDVDTQKDATKLTVLVTGGGRGIGAAVAKRLAADGHAVVLNYLRGAAGAELAAAEITAEGGRAIAARGDVSVPEEVDCLFEACEKAFGCVQGLVHCAGTPTALREFRELDWAAMQRQVDVHVKGAFYCVKKALPGMVKAQSGAIVFLGSIAADGVPPAHQSDYVMAKAALAALARSLAVEYGPKGVRVNVISPGITITDMIVSLPEKAKLLAQMQTPLRRLAEPADIAEVAAFLLNPGARYITGENIRVCGGAVML